VIVAIIGPKQEMVWFWQIWLFCGHLVLTYAVAFVVSLAFEAPLIAIMKLAFNEQR